MPAGLVDDLRGRIASGTVVVVVGAGVSSAVTGGDVRCSWRGLVDSGLAWAARLPCVSSQRVAAARSLLDAGDGPSLIMAAEIVTESLGGREGGEFASWLRGTVGSLELCDRAVPDALVGLGVPVATTNYDDLIERASGYERATWREGAAVQYALQYPQERVVVHLHGHWRAPASV